MPDLDLAAIRARCADRGLRTIAAFRAGLRDTPLDQADEDMAALLDLVDELTVDRDRAFSELRQLADRLREATCGYGGKPAVRPPDGSDPASGIDALGP